MRILLRLNSMIFEVTVDKASIKAKKRSRKMAVQAMYQWQMSGLALNEIERQFCATNDMAKVDVHYFNRLIHDIPKQLSEIEQKFEPYLDRSIDKLNPVELAVLRVGAFELIFCLEMPYRVVLDEAIILAKLFGSQDGHRYVNGVLHNLAKDVRKDEINS